MLGETSRQRWLVQTEAVTQKISNRVMGQHGPGLTLPMLEVERDGRSLRLKQSGSGNLD